MNIDAFIRPSSTDENALCPARPTMQAAVVETLGEQPAAAVAQLGIEAHRWGEAGVRLLAHDPETCEPLEQLRDADDALVELRAAHAKEDPDFQLDSWTWSCVEQYVRFVFALAKKHDIEPRNVLVEEKLDMADLGFVNRGTSDCLLVKPFERIFVIDLKAGFVDQGDAADHGQLAAYGCAAAMRFDAKSVEVWIAQPRAEKVHRFTGATFDMAKLANAAAWIRMVNAACRAPNPELVPAYRQCANCRALLLCPAAKEYIVRAQEALEVIGNPGDADARGDLVGAAKLAQKWADAVLDWGKAQLSAGEPVTGFKLGTPRAIRSISAVALALQKLDAAGMTSLAMEALSLSPTKLPHEALAVIADHVSERLSDPPLVADKRKPVAA